MKNMLQTAVLKYGAAHELGLIEMDSQQHTEG